MSLEIDTGVSDKPAASIFTAVKISHVRLQNCTRSGSVVWRCGNIHVSSITPKSNGQLSSLAVVYTENADGCLPVCAAPLAALSTYEEAA